MKMTNRVLFVVENDYYPHDMRVFNECTSLSSTYSCYVLAPRKKGQTLIETSQSVTCFRFPHFEAQSLALIPFEYAIAAFWIGLLVPLITIVYRIKAIHVANPPDFIIPLVWWLKLLGVRFVFDVHDLSVETFKGKRVSRAGIGRALVGALWALECLSIRLADLVIATNLSIKEYVHSESRGKPISVVRNSNPVLFRSVEEIGKRPPDGVINVGYFGALANDEAAGLDNFCLLAEALDRVQVDFRFSIVGDGPGLSYLQNTVRRREIGRRFRFHGYVQIPEAFTLIRDFDFGVVTWGNLPKNHLHTAMKVMDYMCCAVPVCSIRLKEQLYSTGGIGIHEETFEGIGRRMAEVYRSEERYELLRRRTLTHFNEVLCWERQSSNLRRAYEDLFGEGAVCT